MIDGTISEGIARHEWAAQDVLQYPTVGIDLNIHLPEQETQRVRQRTKDAILSNIPIGIYADSSQGDLMVRASAYNEILNIFCQQEDLPENSFSLVHIPPDEEERSDIFLLEQAVDEIHQNNPSDIADLRWIYGYTAYKLATSLDIPRTDAELFHVPKLYKTTKGSLSEYQGDQWLIDQGEACRADILRGQPDRKIAVIFQSGSLMEKRFVDKQLRQIASQRKKEGTDPLVIVLSDKHFLRQQVDRWNNHQLDPKLEQNFPYEYQPFQQELFQDLSPSNDIDMVKTPATIEELLPYLYAADTIDGTDSYWGNLSGSAQAVRQGRDVLTPDSVRLLYTVADPKAWGIPGVDHRMPQRMRQYLDQMDYAPMVHESFYYPQQDRLAITRFQRKFVADEKRGILPEDMQVFLNPHP